jgi:hypothetical protein
MTVHAFVDESRRNSMYYVAAAIVVPAQLACTRKAMRALLLPGQREIHFKFEKPQRQRYIADAVARLPVEVWIYRRTCERQDEPARQNCMLHLTTDLLAHGAHMLSIDSREHRDYRDEDTIRTALGGHRHSTLLSYQHIPSTQDPLLWIADIAAWCFSAKGDWRARIKPVVGAVHDLDLV